MVVASRNPVHSVLYLILAFVNAAGLFVLMGAEFLAMILIVVYVGAVAVLFLFVVMMLDVDFAELRQGFLNYVPIGGLIGLVFLVELLLVVGAWAIGPGIPHAITAPIPPIDTVSNTEALGLVLYTRYVYFFQIHDWRHRAHAAAQAQRQAPEHRGPGRAHARGVDRAQAGAAGAGDLT
jgi:NADH-quinone oxidoreductase subunit J